MHRGRRQVEKLSSLGQRALERPCAHIQVAKFVPSEEQGIGGTVDAHGAVFFEHGQKDAPEMVLAEPCDDWSVAHELHSGAPRLELFDELCPWAAAFEINVSCPNISAGGAAMGSTPEGAAEVMRACRPVSKKPLLVKMAPVRLPEIARALEAEGADGLTVINSIPGMAIDVHTRRSKISRPTGGLSGPLLHPIAVRMVWEVCQAVDIPVCGVGGVMTGEDAAEFILAGATSVAVGMASFVDPAASVRILHELEEWAESQGVSSINELIGAFEC